MNKIIYRTPLLSQKFSHKYLTFFLIIIIVSGIVFRFNNLALKPYWIDESYTLLRASGYTSEEAKQQLYNGQIIQANDILKYQKISSDRNFLGTVRGLAKEEPQHPPFYFLLTRFWQQIWGTSKVAIRSLPVLCSFSRSKKELKP